jgi:protein-tyrosine-phosphatase
LTEIEDPKGKQIGHLREIRDEIEERIQQLVTNLPKGNWETKFKSKKVY